MKVVSGGQSGVDRAALDAAIACGLAYGGWCPHGGWAEDFPQPPGLLAKYPQLKETPSAEPAQRTEWNVRDCDAVLILVDAAGPVVSPGTQLAEKLIEKYPRPTLMLDLTQPESATRLNDWLAAQREKFGGKFVLSIGGPREGEAPGIYAHVLAFLRAAFTHVPDRRTI
jgi:hypothetical protein